MLPQALLTPGRARLGLFVVALSAATILAVAMLPRLAHAQSGPHWVNDLAYGSAGGGFHWDSTSGQVWTSERGWHLFSPNPPRTVTPLWVNDLTYPSVGGGFYLDPLSNQVWTGECGWHYFNRAGCSTPPPPPVQTGLTVRNVSWYTSSIGSIHVVGEVVNGLAQPAQYVELTARFYSSTNILLATDFSYAAVEIIAPGADAPFDILLFDPPPGLATVSVEATDYVSPPYGGAQPISGLNATVTNTYVSSIGSLHVVGTVTNTSNRTYEFINVNVALYDAAGTVLRVGFTYSEPDSLAPGQTGTFDLLLSGPPPYARYRLWLDAWD